MTSTTLAKYLKKTVIIFIWLAIWQLLSLIVSNSILLVGPVETLIALFSLIRTTGFWLSIANSAIRIILGFIIGTTIGLLLACGAYRAKLFEEFISPLVSVIKTIPVASFVIIVLIWAGAPNLSMIISSFVVFPTIYLNTLHGLKSIDSNLLEMASVFRVKPLTKFKEIYLRSIRPFLISGISLASGMCYKSGIAAEVIGRPKSTIGISLYNSKVYLDTAGLFAWTLVAVLLAFAFEKLIRFMLRRCFTNEN